MCGLLGLICATETDAAAARDAVAAALRCQRHRGPDETDTWADAEVVYGFNRLGFIDLEHSHQPLVWGPPEAPTRYTLNFNGEIYNYLELRAELAEKFGTKFNTDGDGESVVAAYHHLGADAVTKLRGMFAFMIWDAQDKVVFGARDPFGIKPLFYSSGPGGLAFSSEKKSLLELSGTLGVSEELDRTALQHYLVLQYVPEPESLHTGIRRVESGTSFRVVPGGQVEFTRYFHPQFTAKPVDGEAEAEALYERIADVMRDSVSKHMISDPDVTVGAFLSGGIDSTAIAALAKERNPSLIAFTTGFEREGYSEVDVAAESAAAIGVKHVVRTVSADEMMEALPLIVWYLDDPVA
ncbi:MAG: asparagine synthase (glutamine-hydrolyzing), partial [Pseudonocardiales bacterium]